MSTHCVIETERLLKITGHDKVHCKSGISETVEDRDDVTIDH